MSYWSLRRAAERATAGHELARSTDETLAPARQRTVRLPDWTPVSYEPHPATVTSSHSATSGGSAPSGTSTASPSRTLRQRAADLEKALWTVPEQPEPDPRKPSASRPRIPATW